MADGNEQGQQRASASSSAAGALAFLGGVVATAGLTFAARAGSWLEGVPWPHEYDLDVVQTVCDGPLGVVGMRTLGALLLGLSGALVGWAFARGCGLGPVAWLTPLLIASHPAAHMLTHDASTPIKALPLVAGAIALGVALPRWPRATFNTLFAVTVIVCGLNAADALLLGPRNAAELLAPLGDPEAGVPWRRRASFAAPLLILLLLGYRRRVQGDEWPLSTALMILALGLVAATGDHVVRVTPQGEGVLFPPVAATALQLVGLASAVGFAAARAWGHRSDRVVVVASVLLIAFSGWNTARQQDLLIQPARDQARVLFSRLAELPRLDGITYTDLVIGHTPFGKDLGQWTGEQPVRAATDLVSPALGGQLRVSRFGHSKEGWVLDPVFRATRVEEERLALHEPGRDERRPCTAPEHEPTFVWSMPEGEDPGPSGFVFAWAGRPAGSTSRTVRRVSLEPDQLARDVRNGRVFYKWRPSIRGSHQELLWERGDLTRAGSHLTWTIVARPRGRLHGALMAAPRRLTASR